MKRLWWVLVLVSVLSVPVAAQESTPPTTPGPIGPTNVRSSPDSLMASLLEASTGQLSVVGQSPLVGLGAMVVIANGTDAAVGSIAVSGSVRDATGAVAAVGASARVHPSVLEPGMVGLAFVQFQGTAPDGSHAELTVTSGPVPTPDVGDYALEEVGLSNGQALGLIANRTDRYWVQSVVLVACLDSTNTVTQYALPPLPQGAFQAGEVVTFAAPVNESSCTQVIAAGGGIR